MGFDRLAVVGNGESSSCPSYIVTNFEKCHFRLMAGWNASSSAWAGPSLDQTGRIGSMTVCPNPRFNGGSSDEFRSTPLHIYLKTNDNTRKGRWRRERPPTYRSFYNNIKSLCFSNYSIPATVPTTKTCLVARRGEQSRTILYYFLSIPRKTTKIAASIEIFSLEPAPDQRSRRRTDRTGTL